MFLATNRINKLVQLATFLIDEIDIHEESHPLFFCKRYWYESIWGLEFISWSLRFSKIILIYYSSTNRLFG